MSDKAVVIEIRGDIADINAKLQELKRNVQDSGSAAKSAFDSVKNLLAAYVSVQQGWSALQLAAKAQQEERAFANLAASYGRNASTMVADLKRASGETLSTVATIKSAGNAMMMGIKPDEITKLMEIARATSRMTGQDITKAFSDIASGVAKGQKEILDNLGILVNANAAYKDYAASIGKSADELSDLDKKQAFVNATIKAGTDLIARMGEQQDTMADRIARYQAKLEDLKLLLGEGIARAAFAAEAAFKGLAVGILGNVEIMFQKMARLVELLNHIPGVNLQPGTWQKLAARAGVAAEDLSKQADSSWSAAFGTDKPGAAVMAMPRLGGGSSSGDEEKPKKSKKEKASREPKHQEMDAHVEAYYKDQADFRRNYKEPDAQVDAYYKHLQEVEKMRGELSDNIKRMTMSEGDYQRAALEEQTAAMREAAGEDMALQDVVFLYKQLRLIEIREAEAEQAEQYQEDLEAAKEMTKQAFMDMAQGLGQAVGQAVVYGEDLGASFKALMKSIAANVISMMVQIGIQHLLQRSMFKPLFVKEITAEALARQQLAALNAFSSTAAIPVYGPVAAPGVAAAAYAATTPMVTGAISSATAYGDGGISWGPEFALVGEKGPEAHIPLKSGAVPVQLSGAGGMVVNINAVDAASFQSMVERNPNAIVATIKRALMGNSELRSVMREALT